MIDVGCFSEMNIFSNNGSVKKHIISKVNYDKTKIIKYLESFKYKASCPKNAIDCVTNEIISSSFKVYDDGEFRWCDFLIYHIKKYNIKLPQKMIEKANANLTTLK